MDNGAEMPSMLGKNKILCGMEFIVLDGHDAGKSWRGGFLKSTWMRPSKIPVENVHALLL